MTEQFAEVGPVTLCYETFGDPSDPALLLIMGLGTQMVAWRDDFCTQLSQRGFHVIRFDNRDTGRSTTMKGRGPTLTELATKTVRKPAYTLGEMADDAIGLLDHLRIDRAHIVGASMGGMIAQQVAIRYPGRVLSLVSIMSTPGGRIAGAPRLSILPLFLSKPAGGRQEYIERGVKLFRAIGSPDHFDENAVREVAELSYERGLNLAGTARQLAAIMADGNRSKRLGRVTAPTLVIHGTKDKLVTPSGGRATARAIPGARLMKVEGMGHDLPRALWPKFIDAIAENAARAATSEPAEAVA